MKLINIIFAAAMFSILPIKAQSARIAIASNEEVNVRISLPIAGYSQSFFANTEMTLPPNDTLYSQVDLAADELCSIDLVVNNRYLKVMLFNGDSVLYSFNNGELSISGTNAEGHMLYIEKVVGSFQTMPTNMILEDMGRRRNFKDYDEVVNQWLIYPFEEQIDRLVALGYVEKRYAEAAKIDNINNIYCYIYADLNDYRIAESKGNTKKQLSELSTLIEQSYLTTSAEVAARYPQGSNYSYRKAELDYLALSAPEREELLGSYIDKIPESFQYLFTLPRELLALRLLSAYMNADFSINLVRAHGADKSDIDNLILGYQEIYNYLITELRDTEALETVEL